MSCKNAYTFFVLLDAENDFVSFRQTLRFDIGDGVGDSRCIELMTLNDAEEEDYEDFFVVLFYTTQNPTQIVIDSEKGIKTVTITDGNSMRYCKMQRYCNLVLPS